MLLAVLAYHDFHQENTDESSWKHHENPQMNWHHHSLAAGSGWVFAHQRTTFPSVNTWCLARCHRSEGRWKRGENENRWDSPMALLQLTAFSECLETDRPLQQAETALLCLLGSWILKQLPKGSTSQQVRSSKWGLCFSQTKKRALAEHDYRLEKNRPSQSAVLQLLLVISH